MALPIINQFIKPYEIWETRPATDTEKELRLSNGCSIHQFNAPVKIRLIEKIDNPVKASSHMFFGMHNIAIENHIEKSLNDFSSSYSIARRFMPSVTPKILSEYQRRYSSTINMAEVNDAISNSGDFLADGQILFHGGSILNGINIGCSLTTTRPLSTSLCPVKALNNGAWRGKYYSDGQATIIVLNVKTISKRAFVFRINGTDKGYEKEVLIESGATITVDRRDILGQDYSVSASGSRAGEILKKNVTYCVTYATIS